MTETAHTPGPWEAYNTQHGWTVTPVAGNGMGWVYGAEGESDSYLSLTLLEGEGGERSEANARLIAAAPDLLAVARALDDHWTADFPGGPDNWDTPGAATILGGLGRLSEETLAIWRQARAAIERATLSNKD